MANFSSNFRSTLIEVVQSVFRVFGLHLQYYNPSNSEIALVDYLLSQNNIKTIVDVGANEGQFALKLIKKTTILEKSSPLNLFRQHLKFYQKIVKLVPIGWLFKVPLVGR